MGRHMHLQKNVDPAQWRKRYKIAFRALCGTTVALDLAFAILVAIESYDTPNYVYIQAAVFSAIEAAYIAAALTLIVMHKFSDSHKDLGLALLPFWMANLSIDISFFVGASEKASLDDTMFRALLIVAALSQSAGIGLVVLAIRMHVLSLYDPRWAAGGRRSRRGGSRGSDGESGNEGYSKEAPSDSDQSEEETDNSRDEYRRGGR
ncbi:uncharacterized protein JCM6883_003272 [Sporobolomyces salmoneus]|uniref:uncharacterized protein n=1 Tax=Sporobolomyces salmoneus TaxID=183962 RepID=UPI00316EB99C